MCTTISSSVLDVCEIRVQNMKKDSGKTLVDHSTMFESTTNMNIHHSVLMTELQQKVTKYAKKRLGISNGHGSAPWHE